ncbi:ABC transporter substrate-binding protein [Dyadobacter tibetensis]|uniref:ABC transporter substrate-binding protein n=1 Tax=Dyadobacter tibetensis TaxID=1211851 RepID=UPI000472EACA|nr:ABC transporter substrate-binding protein [Dyadobacter tibetensis]
MNSKKALYRCWPSYYNALKAVLTSLSLSTLLLSGCQNSDSQQHDTLSISGQDDLYPDKITLNHARGFSLAYFSHYKLLSIYTPADTSQYVLLERGTAKPEGYEQAATIHIPVRKLVALSSMHIGLLSFLESETVISGLGNLQYVYSPKTLARIADGQIEEVGLDQGINQEKLLVMQPDLVMSMGGPESSRQQFPVLRQASIPILANAEWLETTPLARAEWVKLMAALLNKEALVNRKFAAVEQEYARLSALVPPTASRPTILTGLNTKDSWYLPSGENYMAQFFTDAGGNYPWKGTKGNGSIPLNFESVYPKALHADVWLNVGYDPSDTQQGLIAIDQRYADFKAMKAGKLYSYNNRVNERGSNDFFESGVVAPDLVLADLIKILHPTLLPNHRLYYYKQLPK